VSRRAAAVALVAAVALSGCGRSKAREVRATLAEPRGCFVQVFFASRMVTGREATRDEIRALRERIAASAKVRTFAFVSKPLALRRMAKKEPDLTRNLHANPLPAGFEIVPRSGDAARSLVHELGSERGVEHVSVARAC
jgi:cell division protein FtsX